jgi:hypothetical protein
MTTTTTAAAAHASNSLLLSLLSHSHAGDVVSAAHNAHFTLPALTASRVWRENSKSNSGKLRTGRASLRTHAQVAAG